MEWTDRMDARCRPNRSAASCLAASNDANAAAPSDDAGCASVQGIAHLVDKPCARLVQRLRAAADSTLSICTAVLTFSGTVPVDTSFSRLRICAQVMPSWLGVKRVVCRLDESGYDPDRR